MEEIIFADCIGFQWDAGNKNKNQDKHNVSQLECEQLFFNSPLLVYEDIKHSHSEKRIYALGKTAINRKLFIAFTIRDKKIRVISARDMNQKERKFYEKNQENSEI